MPIQRKTCRAEQRISNDRKSFFPPCSPCSRVEGSSAAMEWERWNGEGSGVIGKRAKVGWLVSRRKFRREQDDKRAWQGRKLAAPQEKEWRRRTNLPKEFSLPSRPQTERRGGRSLKKRIYNLLLAEPLKDSPRYWKNIRKGEWHTDPPIRVRFSIPRKYKGPDIK